MSLARATDCNGLNWPGDLSDKNVLPLDRVANFLTNMGGYIPVERFAEDLPSDLARYLASPSKNLHSDGEPRVTKADEEAGKQADSSIQPEEQATEDAQESEVLVDPVAAQKLNNDKKKDTMLAKYVNDRLSKEQRSLVKRSDTAGVKKIQFDLSLLEALKDQHTGQQVIFICRCPLLCLTISAVWCALW
jgi:hypothetical protein